ncbi:MAG TPA: hypothetical protein VMV77_04815 [Bacteroidales bacterium]|nr:hypothetical protein [Bacteroidales bacterium]
MTSQTITIKQGDAVTLSETITGLDSLAGYTAKMYIKDSEGTEIDTLTGSITDLIITYEIVNEDSKAYTVGEYFFETKIFNVSDLVYTPSEGLFVIESTLENDPE